MTKKQIEKAKAKLLKQDRKAAFKRLSSYLMIVGGLPYICDLIEDLNDTIFLPELNKELDRIVEILIHQDDIFLTGADVSVIEQQNNIKLAFREFQNDMFKNDLK
jgi:Ni,Fe-hydrogenase III large subunit